jgi:uncharacterized protein (DUF58 family)
VRLFSLSNGGITDSRWYLLGAALLLLGIILHLPLLVVVSILMLVVIGMTDIWSRYCFEDLHYKRQLSEKRVLFGEEVILSLTIENAKLLPLPWLELEEHIPRMLKIKGQQLQASTTSNSTVLECLFSPGWYERVTRHYTVQCQQRGVHAFGPTTLRSGDVFGFNSCEMSLDNYQYVLVYPLVVPLTRFGLPARHPFGDRRAPRRLLEDPSRVIGVRDYTYGDNLRRVDWKATARTLQLQSKVYDATTTYTLMLFLNTEARPDIHYSIHPELQELAICAAASVADWAIDNDYAVGLYSNTIMFMPDEDGSIGHRGSADGEKDLETLLAGQLRRRRIRVPAARSEEQRKHILEVLARIQSYFGTSIEQVMQAELAHLPAGATVVVITSTMSEQMIDKLVRARQGGHAVAVLFVGDGPAPQKLAGVSIYHLGGETTWNALVAASREAATTDEGTFPIVPGLRL